MSTAVTVESLSKKYIIRHQNLPRHETVRDVVSSSVRSLMQKVAHPLTARKDRPSYEEFWALKDVDFDIRQGERVGIIGRNGAGKSTLLKILSRITEPTTGRVKIRGRIASLLEVGTGFNPELTGRENIFLNGAILGMKKTEIKKKFDAIVAFAEVEKFLDTPVKHYSSGMYMRLAFAVAAHLEPEILVVDEVLAVGDAQFQKKCLGKMEEVGKEGRTILFVSHNMQAVRQLCSRGILLNGGQVLVNGMGETAIARYLQEGIADDDADGVEKIIKGLPADPTFRLERVTLLQNGHTVRGIVENGCPLELEMQYHVFEKTVGLRVYFDLTDDQDLVLFRSFNDEDGEGIPMVEPGIYMTRAVIPMNLLGPIRYTVNVGAGIHNIRSCLPDGVVRTSFDVHHTSPYNRAYAADSFRGRLAPVIPWQTEILVR